MELWRVLAGVAASCACYLVVFARIPMHQIVLAPRSRAAIPAVALLFPLAVIVAFGPIAIVIGTTQYLLSVAAVAVLTYPLGLLFTLVSTQRFFRARVAARHFALERGGQFELARDGGADLRVRRLHHVVTLPSGWRIAHAVVERSWRSDDDGAHYVTVSLSPEQGGGRGCDDAVARVADSIRELRGWQALETAAGTLAIIRNGLAVSDDDHDALLAVIARADSAFKAASAS